METEKPQPKIYVADVVVDAKIPQRSTKVKKYDLRTFRLNQHPFIMYDGDIATERQKKRLYRAIYDRFIHKGDFKEVIFTLKEINNVKFMSTLSYRFDYNND
jgi:hypothetical protein